MKNVAFWLHFFYKHLTAITYENYIDINKMGRV